MRPYQDKHNAPPPNRNALPPPRQTQAEALTAGAAEVAGALLAPLPFLPSFLAGTSLEEALSFDSAPSVAGAALTGGGMRTCSKARRRDQRYFERR